MQSRQYDADVLAAGKPGRRRPGQREVPKVEAERGLVVEDSEGRFCGAVVGYEKGAVHAGGPARPQTGLPAHPGRVPARGQGGHAHPLPGPSPSARPARTASGSVAAPTSRAKVARASRIYVEGKHDAELVEQIWGDDLRDVGVVVEYLEGIDDLPAIVADFAPAPGRRLGVLVDHLVAGSKETRIVASVRSPHVLIVGHPFIDIWAAVRPSSVGIRGLAATFRPGSRGRRASCAPSAGRPRCRRPGSASCVRSELRRPGARTSGAGRGAHRFRHHARKRIA